MIRIVYALHRLPRLTRKDCHKHWQEVHAPIVKKHAELLGIHGYTQLHTVSSRFFVRMMRLFRGTMEPYDGVAEYWVDREKMSKALKTPAGQQAMDELIKDEALFIDFPRSALWLGREHIIVENSAFDSKKPARKLIWVGSGLSLLSSEQFQDHYLNKHAPLVKGYADAMGIKRYVQVHTVDDPLNDILRSARGAGKLYDVHAEFIWNFGEMVLPVNLRRMKQAMAEISADEKRFIDFSRSAIWITEEHVVIPLA